jgi:phospholysine phosphohistidine inorganic pyrophosphate phosphatase
MENPAVRGLLVDLDGTVYQNGRLIPGAAEALAELTRRGIAHRFVTNTTSKPASAIVAELARMGLDVDPAALFTAPQAAREFLLARGWTRCHMLVREALLEDFQGIEPVDGTPDAVVLGDVGDAFTYERLNEAFRMLLDGAALVTMARNRYYLGAGGLLLDVGPYAMALEYASGREAVLVGKPASEFFRRAFESLGIAPSQSVVVGDDLDGDVGGGQVAGARGILVRTGKFREDALARSSIRPDAVIDSLADLLIVLSAE